MPAFAAPDGYRRYVVGDAELALAAAGGDRDALASIYDRYADSLYEMCRVILRDAHEASDAVQDTFVIAATRLGGLRDPDRLKPWLFAIARREAIRRSSKRARNRPSHDEVLDVPVIDESADGLMANDAANLVWEAAEALSERERALLMLNVRQGLEGSDLADAAGMPSAQASVVLSRAKTQLATAVRCTLLIRGGRAACTELSAIVPHAHAALDGLTRKRVARHAQDCEICEPKWNATPSALGVLAAAPLLGVPAALKTKVLNDPRLISSSKPLGGSGWSRDGFPPAEDRPRRRIVAGMAAALVLITVAVGLVLAGNSDTRSLAATDSPETTLAPDTSTSSSVDGAGGATTSSGKRTTTTGKKTTPTTARPGGVTPTTAAPAPTTTTTIALTISASSDDSTISTSGVCAPRSTTVRATASGSPQPGVMKLHIRNGSSLNTVGMTKSGSTWSAALGPFDNPGTVEWWVTAHTGLFSPELATTSHRAVTIARC